MLSRKVFNVFMGCLLISTLSLVCAAESRAAFGDIVGRYNSVSGAWWGGLAWKDGYIYENLDNTSTIYQRDPNTANLAVVGTIAHTAVRDIGLAWDEDNRCWWLCNPWGPRNVYRIPEEGGGIAFSFNANTNEYGIFYDTMDEVLWITNNAKKALDIYYTNGTRVRQITMPWDQSGIVRVGDKLWIGRHETSYIYEFTLDGAMTGRSVVIPEGRFSGDMAFDGRYLWSRSNLKSNAVYVYKIDIGITPAPVATPTPASALLGTSIDSGDYNGDGTSYPGIFREDSGLWAIKGITRAYFGTEGDIPASGDYSGDGTTDLAVFRPSLGLWAVRNVTRFYFGSSGDIPAPGDYSGLGTVAAAIYRPSSGLWAIRGESRIYFGGEADYPIPLYLDGRVGPKRPAVFRPSSGLWAIRGETRVYFGAQDDIPVAGRYDDDLEVDVAIYRPLSSLWAVRSVTRAYFGGVEDQPVTGNYTGFLPDNFGIFRDSNGLWAVRGVTRLYFGTSGDLPVSGLAINPSSALGS